MNHENKAGNENLTNENAEDLTQETADKTETGESTTGNEVENFKKEIEELKDKYLRLYSEFENFRRRSAKEKIDYVKTASEDVLVSLLPILDDFERAKASIDTAADKKAISDGVDLIYHKLFKTVEQKGLKAMDDLKGKPFDSELHEAITQTPAPSEDLKGKVVDVIEKGYYLNDKVVRYAKVIIGA